ncbi:MAG: hypothetical protein CVU34_14805 [Betaproteobacteria bacterium HGW-Betaproteobacteria-7]|nr:MAG: hypothetical protein CVU34_14805 [Betaproteobacteria bacterium HGW-Betaproteobacteria-7]
MRITAVQDDRTAGRDGRHDVVDGTAEQVSEDETGAAVMTSISTGFLSMPGAIAGTGVMALVSVAVMARMLIVAGVHRCSLIVRRQALRRLPAVTRREDGGQHDQQQQAGNGMEQRAHGGGL